MKSNGSFRLASSRLQSAITALPKFSSFGVATVAFALSASGTLGQTTIASGQNILSNDSSLSLGALTRNSGGTLLVSGTGAGSLSASATLTNGILPWALIQSSGTATNNSSAGYTFATISGGNLVAYTSATAVTAAGAWGGLPSGGTGTVNYDASGGFTATGLARDVNSIRFTGAGGVQTTNNSNFIALKTNALLNAGTGDVAIGAASGNVAALAIGANSDLVLAAASSSITFNATGRIYNTGATNNGSGVFTNGGTASAVTITGPNTVNFGGSAFHTGATYVNGGTLAVGGAGTWNNTSGIIVNGTGAKYVHTSSVASTRTITLTKGTVDGTGTLGAVNVGDDTGGIVSNGNGGTGTLTIGTLAFSGGATITGNYVIGSKPINVTGTLSTIPANGQVAVNLSAPAGWTTGLNNIIGFGSFAGSAADFTVGSITGMNARQSVGGLSLNGSNVALTINGDNPKWTGSQSGAWTSNVIGGSSNWQLVTAGTATDFIAADNAVFDDTASGVTAVDITTANVAPTTTVFNHSTKDYTLSSTGGFGISSGSLTKSGSGALTIGTANTYSGGTTLNAGTLNVNNAGALGTGALTVNGGTLGNTSGSPITTTTAIAQTWNGSFATGSGSLNFNGGAATVAAPTTLTMGGGTLTIGSLSNANSTLNLAGSGTLAVTTTNPTYVGYTTGNGVMSIDGVNFSTGGDLRVGGSDVNGTAHCRVKCNARPKGRKTAPAACSPAPERPEDRV